MSRLAKDIDVTHLHQRTQPDVVKPARPELDRLSRWQAGGKISKDIDAAHLRRWPDQPMNLASRSWLLAISPGLRLILLHRINRWLHFKRELGGWRGRFWQLMVLPIKLLRLGIKINTKSYVDTHSEIEGSVCFSDHGHIVLGTRKIGAGTVIGARVTIGMGHVNNGRPEIRRNVWIGSDCVIYGAITIGDGATLLPGTVLAKSIPAGVVMRGNPARVVLRNFDNSELRARQNIDAVHYVNAKQGGGG